MSDLPPAGWYPDPTGGQGRLRFWDGSVWTEHLHGSASRPSHDAPEGWWQSPEGRWYPPDDGRRYWAPRTGVVDSAGWDPSLPVGWETAIPDPIPQSGRPGTTYWSDLKWSARTLAASPWLVVLSVALVAMLDVGYRDVRPVALTRFLTFVAEVFEVGFVGTQRVWFLRKERGGGVEPREVWSLSWRFFGRFLCLGLLFAVAFAIVLVPTAIATFPPGGTTTTTSVPGGFTASLVGTTFVLDVVLTFVVPALALSTRSVRSAFRIGWRITASLWPTNLWYLFAPGITLLALAGALPRSLVSNGVAIVLGLIGALLGLWFKGANAAFYIRAMPPASSYGAA